MKRAVPFGVMRNGMISNRTRRSCLAISDGMQMEILFKNAAFLTSWIFASAMIRVFPSLEHSTGHVRTPKTICRTFVCRTCPRRIVQTWKRHGIRCKYLAERNALNFSQRIFHPHFHLKSKGMIPSSYFFSRQTGLSAESDRHVFVQSAEAARLFAGHLLFLLHAHFLDHLAADASGLCGSQVAVVAVL